MSAKHLVRLARCAITVPKLIANVPIPSKTGPDQLARPVPRPAH